METKKYQWTYCSLGDAVRVNITSGEDIAHLGELDQKLWTVLSCPVKGLEFDEKTLKLLDTDSDGKIRVPEVVSAARWLTTVLKDKDSILEGRDVLKLSAIDESNEEGAALLASARQILANLHLDADELTLAQAEDGVAIFAGTPFNGDGLITTLSTQDEGLKSLISTISDKMGSSPDRSGEPGISAEAIESFYTALKDYSAWKAEGEARREEIFPYGDDTASAKAAVQVLGEKIADYFMRCRLIAFDSDASTAVDVPTDKISAISSSILSSGMDEIAQLPLARPSAASVLSYDGINPAWEAQFASLKKLVLDKEYPESKEISEAQWKAILAKLSSYDAYLAAKKGSEVESLGEEVVNKLLEEDKKATLLALVEQDKQLASEAASIDAVAKLVRLYRDFAKLLRNYVLFSDFYSRDAKTPAIFEAGQLYIDQRCCKLCVRVEDMSKHADMAAQSGMFLVYCTCTSKTKGSTMNIVAVMTAGNVFSLRPGKNGVFYDRNGEDWDAVVTKVVDNPLSIRQAFWNPYRKLAAFVTDKINKNAAAKEADSTSKLLAVADKSNPAAPAQQFDIAKFAGIFAAIGMAVGAIGVAISSLFKGLFALSWWQLLLVIVVIMLMISGPSCFIAWTKLRKRNLGPILNANGWAINSVVLINIIFGGTLTSVAKYPRLRLSDPYSSRTPAWKKWLYGIILALIVAGAAFFVASDCCKEEPEQQEVVEEVVAETGTETETATPES